ncbi:SMI1/KNR4 family protein [Flavivirga eckloniae]|uniref:Knr4/Smi1-like domain-containing protein n=1 Tax=Flavivirga eckloniae TaxID=1803846 RepID=A0A2K9PQY7_9FLAO|nr:SMI1/KNR4 family protein [Flavivirga eckloniae]AUP79456.1 hypothetical protein C1H87_12365 [Flavivirga eckloniae]
MKWLENIIDSTLDKMVKEGILMSRPDPDMPAEMFDPTIPIDNDWKGWKPIPSVLDDSDLNRLEEIIGIELPLSYRHFLKHKHFYVLDIPDFAVNFPTHLPDKNLDGFMEWFFEFYEPELLIEKGLIYFADFQDYGLLCFDSNIKRENNEYPIVYIDHEDLSTKYHYSDNFRELITADRERGNRFIMELNEYYKKQ